MRGILTLILVCLLAVPAFAAFQGPGVEAGVNSAAQVLAAKQEIPCVLEGAIVRKMAESDDKYLFQDASGQVVVEIDNKVFAGRTVTPTTVVILQGKVDMKKNGPNEADIKVLEVIVP